MLFDSPPRFAVDLPPREVMARIVAETRPHDVKLRGDNLVDQFSASYDEHLDRISNQRFLSHIRPPIFEIEASGLIANQMGKLRGELTRWGTRTIVEARYVPNKNTWLTVSVVGAILLATIFGALCTGVNAVSSNAGVGGLVCIVCLFGFPGIIAAIVGVLQYMRARRSAEVLSEFLTKLFADVAIVIPKGPPESTRSN